MLKVCKLHLNSFNQVLIAMVAVEKHCHTHRLHTPIDSKSILLTNLPLDEGGPSHTMQSGEYFISIRSASVCPIEQDHLIQGLSVVCVAVPLDPQVLAKATRGLNEDVEVASIFQTPVTCQI